MTTEKVKEKKERTPKDGVGKCATDAIKSGKTNDEVLAIVRAKFPEAKTTAASINWYRNKLRGEGHDVKTSRELNAAKPKPEKAKAKKGETKDPLS